MPISLIEKKREKKKKKQSIILKFVLPPGFNFYLNGYCEVRGNFGLYSKYHYINIAFRNMDTKACSTNHLFY